MSIVCHIWKSLYHEIHTTVLFNFSIHWARFRSRPFSDPNKNFESNNKLITRLEIDHWSGNARIGIVFISILFIIIWSPHNPQRTIFNRPEIDFQMEIGRINRTETEKFFLPSQFFFTASIVASINILWSSVYIAKSQKGNSLSFILPFHAHQWAECICIYFDEVESFGRLGAELKIITFMIWKNSKNESKEKKFCHKKNVIETVG